MKFLFWTFIAMALYGLVMGKLGAAMLALLVAGVVIYGSKRLTATDREWTQSPRSASNPPDTVQQLVETEQESGRSNF